MESHANKLDFNPADPTNHGYSDPDAGILASDVDDDSPSVSRPATGGLDGFLRFVAGRIASRMIEAVSYTHLRAHET